MTLHETIIFDQPIAAPAARVFAAFADPVERAIWSAPSDDAEVRIDACDFRTEGSETARCGARGGLRYALDIRYHLIVPDQRIVFSEAVREHSNLLTVALITIEFTATTFGTQLRLTDQVASFVGSEGIAGHRQGYTQSLARLAATFTRDAEVAHAVPPIRPHA